MKQAKRTQLMMLRAKTNCVECGKEKEENRTYYCYQCYAKTLREKLMS